jgi:hypothetical protein
MPTIFRLESGELGMWTPEIQPEAAPGMVAFSAAGADAEVETVWRVDLPADAAAADALLERAEDAQRAEDEALMQAEARLQALSETAASGIASFSVPQSESEAELFSLLAQAGADESTPLSFSAQETSGWRAAVAEFERFSAMVRDLVGGATRVETAVAGRLIGATRIGLTGSLRTTVSGIDEEIAARHQRSVTLMLMKRGALLRTAGVALSGAAGLATLVGRPDGIIRAVPAALRYIRSVQAEFTALRRTDSDAG